MPDLSLFPTIAFPVPIVLGGGILLAFASNYTKQVKAAPLQRRAKTASPSQADAPQRSPENSATAETAIEQVAPKAPANHDAVLPEAGVQLPPRRQRNGVVPSSRRSPRSISFDIRGDRPS
ncbi:MAG: hypothetical protein ACFB4J_16845 [Elainellaceae cyanobacterium]